MFISFYNYLSNMIVLKKSYVLDFLLLLILFAVIVFIIYVMRSSNKKKRRVEHVSLLNHI